LNVAASNKQKLLLELAQRQSYSLPPRARTRRRAAARPARSACSVQRQLAARFDGEVAGGAVADFFFVILRFGATMELGRSGR
jgi:hypothetical protein